MTNGILQSIKQGNINYIKKFLERPSSTNESKYKTFWNRLNTLIKTTKVAYYNEKFTNAKSNIKQTWNVINNLLNRKCKSKSNTSFTCDGQSVDQPIDIANAFNVFFTEIGPSLDGKIPPGNTNHNYYL